jgi:diguanylate cyclase (GGDEF)-like protein
MASTGMIIDGVLGSQCVDSSGEILDVEGADISDLEEGKGVLNYEHKSSEDKASNGQEIVGKILTAKKVMKEADCDNSRQRAYWSKVKHPFIYGICRLYDGAGHDGAKALAAQIRDHHANGEPILVRFSVEGSTLEKEGNTLKRSVIRRVALTLKPCNKTADSGLIEDPNAPSGFDKKPTQRVGDILADIAEDAKKMEHQHPGFAKLGGVTELEYVEFSEEDHRGLVKSLARIKAIKKALEAGVGDAAPSTLTQGAALQREDRVGFKAKAMKSLKSYLDKNEGFDRAKLVTILKQDLPEASDDFIDHFANIAEDYHVKLRKREAGEDLGGPNGGDTDVKVVTPEAAPFPAPTGAHEPTPVDRASEKNGIVPPKVKAGIEMRQGGELLLPPPGKKREAGKTPPRRLKLQQHFPNDHMYQSILDPSWGLENGHIDHEQAALINKTVHEPWHRAMKYWVPLNAALKDGKVPKGVLAKATIFAAMSPNTSVPMQEYYYGHYLDMLNEGKVDPFKPISEDAINEFTDRSVSGALPKFNREFYEAHPLNVNGKGQNEGDRGDKGELPQIRGLRSAHMFYPRLEDLVGKYRDDTQGVASELMNLKHQHETKNKRTHPDLDGYGPKLTRYLLGMLGGGNMIVPDRHMIRSLFDLELVPGERSDKFTGTPELEKLQTQVFTDAKNERFLRAIDHNFFVKHPAVQHVLGQFPKHFQGREQQAVFPAFWLHWLTIGHYDKMRGRPFAGFNTDTDHRVFWDSIHDEMIKHGLVPHPLHEGGTPIDADDSFDFGFNKHEVGLDPWPRQQTVNNTPVWLKAANVVEALRQRWGETPALFAFFSHIAPKILRAETPVPPVQGHPHISYHPHVLKAEALLINLKKAMSPEVDPAMREVAPFVHHVYVFKVAPDLSIKRHAAGRFLTAGNHLHILEDYHGDLGRNLTEGPLDQNRVTQIASFGESRAHEVVPMSDLLSGDRPELWQPPEAQPARPASAFEIHRTGQSDPDHLEFIGGAGHLNGTKLEDHQLKSILDHVKRGHAAVRYKQASVQATKVQKMELVFHELMKNTDPAHAEKVHSALDRLDQLVKAGLLEPHHADVLRQHTFTDPATGNSMGNKFAYQDFLNRTQGRGGVHVVMDGNDFKSVNDRFGHETGDHAIRAMGGALRSAMDEAVGQGEGKLFRVGGDEFAAHVPTHEHAARFARALRQKLDALPAIQGSHKLSMGLGFGVDPHSADMALYEAKKQKYHPESMIGNDSRKWVSRFAPGTAPSLAHSLVPGFEGPVPLHSDQLHVKPPPEPMPKPPAPEPLKIVQPTAAPSPVGAGPVSPPAHPA